MGSRRIKIRAKRTVRTVKLKPESRDVVHPQMDVVHPQMDVVHPQMDLVQRQIERFREKFGREPGKDDPLFFDPDSFIPRPLDLDELTADTLKAMEKAGTRPEIVYAFRKTGLLVTEDNIDQLPQSSLAEWEAAVEEYFALIDPSS